MDNLTPQSATPTAPFAVPGGCPRRRRAFVPHRPLHTLRLPLPPPPAAGRLVAPTGELGDGRTRGPPLRAPWEGGGEFGIRHSEFGIYTIYCGYFCFFCPRCCVSTFFLRNVWYYGATAREGVPVPRWHRLCLRCGRSAAGRTAVPAARLDRRAGQVFPLRLLRRCA